MKNDDIDEKDAGSILFCAQGYAALFKRALASGQIDGVTAKTQLDILVTLELSGDQSMGSLGKRLCKAPEQISRATRSLREAGLIDCERDGSNRSVVIASLTDKGRQDLDAYCENMYDSIRAFIGKLDPAARETFIKASLEVSNIFLNIKP